MSKHGHVMYSSDGHGKWYRTKWKAQCGKRAYILSASKCQGVMGHKGVHWAFGASGDFQWSNNDDDPTEDAACGSIPPGHKTYRTPKSMQKHHYMTKHKTKRVRDKKIIAKLEKDRAPEKDATIDKPVDMTKFSR